MNHIFEYVSERSNTESYWLQSDSENAYKEYTSYGKNLYAPNEFTYKFNSNGFRCDNFDENSELPVVFLGCSCTEGVGLPLEHTWGYKLHSLITNSTKKKIPFWNLALGGLGLDAQVSLLYWISSKHKIKHVFGLMPPLSRREYRFYHNTLQMWTPSFGDTNIDRLFSDEYFSNHQSERSMMILDSVIQMNNATCDIAYWGTVDDDKRILNSYKNVNFVDHTPTGGDIARDNIHFGPSYHTKFAALMWYKSKSYFTI